MFVYRREIRLPHASRFSLIKSIRTPNYSASLVYFYLAKINKYSRNATWQEKSHFSSTYPNLKIEPKIGGKKHQMGWRNMRKICGPKLSGYILMLPILQSQILICLFNIFLGQRSIFISMCLACVLKK